MLENIQRFDRIEQTVQIFGWDEIEFTTLQNNLFVSVSCTIMQKNGAGIHLGHSCFWDASNDNTIIAKWPKKEKDANARLVCITTIFGVAF